MQWSEVSVEHKRGGPPNEYAMVYHIGPRNLLLHRRLVVRLRNHILMHNSQGGLSNEAMALRSMCGRHLVFV